MERQRRFRKLEIFENVGWSFVSPELWFSDRFNDIMGHFFNFLGQLAATSMEFYWRLHSSLTDEHSIRVPLCQTFRAKNVVHLKIRIVGIGSRDTIWHFVKDVIRAIRSSYKILTGKNHNMLRITPSFCCLILKSGNGDNAENCWHVLTRPAT